METIRLKINTEYKGNPYFAGDYKASELPEAILKDPSLVERDTKTDLQAMKGNAIQEQTVTIGGEKDNKILLGSKGMGIVDDKEEKTTSKAINVNTAGVDELSTLEGITVSNAQKVVEERAKSKFVDLADLDKRVALRKNRKWSEFSNLTFS